MPYILDKLRSQYPVFQDLDDTQLVQELYRDSGSKLPFNEFAVQMGLPADKPWYDDAKEIGRQIGAGFAVDLPRMVGQGARWIGDDGGALDDWGRSVVESADARAPGWEPTLQGRGLVAETLIKGGRAVGPMAPALAAGFLPGGQVLAPVVAGATFGPSAAQSTEDKLRQQGVPDEEATRAGRITGIIQGGLEAAGTAAAGLVLNPARRALFGNPTMSKVVQGMTDTRVLSPLAKGMGLNMLVQPTTEVTQDVGTELVERAYGAAPEDAWQIAKDSAQGAIGLTALLGPFAVAAQVSKARAGERLRDALSPDADPNVQAQARDYVVGEARRQGVAPEQFDAWLDEQFVRDDALFAARQATQAPVDPLSTADAQRFAAQTRYADLLAPQPGPLEGDERAAREREYAAMLDEPTGRMYVDPKTQMERPGTVADEVGFLTKEEFAAERELAKVEREQAKAAQEALKLEAEGLGIKGTKRNLKVFTELRRLSDAGELQNEVLEELLDDLRNGRVGTVRKFLAASTDPSNPVGAVARGVSAPQPEQVAGQAPAAPGAQTAPVQPAVQAQAPGAPAQGGPGVGDRAPGSDAGNGFSWAGTPGERYRVGIISATGGLALEKRLKAGTSATFYVGKDGGLVDADGVNLVGSGAERLWIPPSKEAADAATAILEEMGRLALADPKRAEAKARLKALVTGAAGAPAAPGASVVQQPVVAQESVDVGRTVAGQPGVQPDGGVGTALPVGSLPDGSAGGGDAPGGPGTAQPRPAANAVPSGVVQDQRTAAPALKSPAERLEKALIERFNKPGRKTKKTALTDLERRRIRMRFGMDPESGEIVSPPRTPAEIAAIETALFKLKKPLSRQAIENTLKPFGLTDAVVARFAAFQQQFDTVGDTLTDEELAEIGDSEALGDAPVTGMSIVDTNDDSIESKAAGGGFQGTKKRLRATLEAMVDPKQFPGFTDEQRAVLQSVLDLDRPGMPRNAEGHSFIQAADRMVDNEVFTPEQRTALEPVFRNTKGQNAQARRDAAVAQATAKADPALVARNEAVTAENERLLAELESAAADVAKERQLTDLLPRGFEQKDIDDGAEAWAEYAGEPVEVTRKDPADPKKTVAVELAAPAWQDLSVGEQARWVKLTAAFESGDIGAKEYSRGFDEIVDQHELGRQRGSRQAGQPTDVRGDQSGLAQRDRARPAAGEEDGARGVERQGDPSAPAGLDLPEDGDLNPADNRPSFKRGPAGTGSTVEQVTEDVGKLAPVNPGKLVIVQSVEDLRPDVRRAVERDNVPGTTVRGLVYKGTAYMIADGIPPGQAASVFMHDVGVHLGIEELLPPATVERLARKVWSWAESETDSLESQLAKRALERVGDAGTPVNQLNSEMIAYFVSEAVDAGIDPTAMRYQTGLQRWMNALVRAFRTALAKLNIADGRFLTAQNVVDLAYGMANQQMTGKRVVEGSPGAGRPAESGRVQFSLARSPKEGTVQRAIAQMPKPLRAPVRNSVFSLKDWADKGLDRVIFTGDLVKRAMDAGITSAGEYARLQANRGSVTRAFERDVERIADMYALVPEKDRAGETSVNQFLFDSTREGKWGYGDNADPATQERFLKLAPESRAFVQAVFQHGAEMLARKKSLVLESTASEYDLQIKAAKDAGDTKGAAELTREKAASLKRFSKLFTISAEKPYAPIRRLGNYVVVYRSPELRAAQDPDTGDAMLAAELELDEKHYSVTFTDTKMHGRKLQEEMARQYGDGNVSLREREAHDRDGDSMLMALSKLRQQVEGDSDTSSRGAMLKLISDLYLETLAENSARKAEMRRRGIAGRVDMLQSFTVQGRADANFLSSVQYNEPIQNAFQKMRKQKNHAADETRASEIFNELDRRYAQSMTVEHHPWLNRLTRMTSIWFLATSPAYYLQNLTQPWMMSLPAMAGRHDYAKSGAALWKAYGELKGVMQSARLLDQGFDFDKVPADVRSAIGELVNRGRIDIGMETELGEFQMEGRGQLRDRWNKIDKGLRLAVQKVESINRLSTAIAAYRLEMERTGNAGAALDYADRILEETHGDYTRFNAPRAFNTGLGKVALQFRKFQLIQLSFYAKLVKDAFEGKDRAVALKTLGYALAHTGAMAGVMGLPGYAAVAWVLGKILGDDDEKFDLTYELREAIGDSTLATMIMRGAPTLAGADLSGKLGAGTALSIMPFSNANLSTPQGVTEAVGTALGGASLGMATRLLDGAGQMMGGDWYRGLERMLPKGFGDAMKAYRTYSEGMTRPNGDVLLPAEDVSEVEALLQAIGIVPADQSVVYERRSRAYEMGQNFQDRATRVKNDYVRAVKEQDREAMAEAREAWQKLQSARRDNGFKPQPMSTLMKAPQEQRRRERDTVGGVQYNRNNQEFAERQAQL